MPYSIQCHPVTRAGLTNILVAVPYNGQLMHLGHATDQIDIQSRPYLLDVPGDRNGGSQGPPIEIQYLGQVYIISFTLSSFVGATVAYLQDWCQTVSGQVAQADVGQFVMSTKSVRLLLEAPSSTTNFVCCIPREPIRFGVGTKYTEFAFQFEAHRAPCGHASAGVIWNTTGS